MFTGLIEEIGTVQAIRCDQDGGRQLTVRLRRLRRGLRRGESIAVNGCCLTVERLLSDGFQCHLSRETWQRTTFTYLQSGHHVNLERPLKLGSRVGGHFVLGHVDGVGRVSARRASGRDVMLDIAYPARLRRLFIPKGSIAVDGVSLTIGRITPRAFRIYVIPATLRLTTLGAARRGTRVNVEADVLGKYLVT